MLKNNGVKPLFFFGDGKNAQTAKNRQENKYVQSNIFVFCFEPTLG